MRLSHHVTVSCVSRRANCQPSRLGPYCQAQRGVPVHQALCVHVNLSLGRFPGNVALVDQTTDGSIRFVTTPATWPRRYGDGHSQWPWHRSDATAFTGSVKMMMKTDLADCCLILIPCLFQTYVWKMSHVRTVDILFNL